MKAILSFFKNLKQKTDFDYFQNLVLEGDADAQFNFGNTHISGHMGYIDPDKQKNGGRKQMREKLAKRHATPVLGHWKEETKNC